VTRGTSIAAYHRACTDGDLRGARRKVYEWLTLIEWPRDPTSAEVLIPHVDNVNLWRARFTELSLIGAIGVTGQRQCSITHRQALTWTANPYPWTAPPRRATDRELLRAALEAIDNHADDAGRAEAARIREMMAR
jgi:hypothetical protein